MAKNRQSEQTLLQDTMLGQSKYRQHAEGIEAKGTTRRWYSHGAPKRLFTTAKNLTNSGALLTLHLFSCFIDACS